MGDKFTQTLNANDSVLLLIDYQAKILYGVESSDRTLIQNNVLALAKGAQILNAQQSLRL